MGDTGSHLVLFVATEGNLYVICNWSAHKNTTSNATGILFHLVINCSKNMISNFLTNKMEKH